MAGRQVHIPEVIEPDERLPQDLVALRRFARLLDEAVAVPGTNRRVGLDAALGLVPGVGDVISGALSLWIIFGALRHRVPSRIVFRMVVNVVVDLLLGAIPLLGDVFDFVFEQNVMNMRLLLQHRNRQLPPRSTAQITSVAFVIAMIVLLVAFGAVALSVGAIIWLAAQRNV